MRRWLIVMICLLALTGCSVKLTGVKPQRYDVLAGELDMGMGLSISPSKLLILNATGLLDIPITVKNKTESLKELTISFKRAMKLADGYEHLDLDAGSYFIAYTENKVRIGQAETRHFNLIIKERYADTVDREIWLSLWDSTGEQVRQELIVRILFKARKL